MLLVALVALAVPMGASSWTWEDGKNAAHEHPLGNRYRSGTHHFSASLSASPETGQVRILWKRNPDRLCLM